MIGKEFRFFWGLPKCTVIAKDPDEKRWLIIDAGGQIFAVPNFIIQLCRIFN